MKPSLYNRLSFKLLIPLSLCGIAIIVLMSIVTYIESETTREAYVNQLASELSESFLIAIEVNSSRSSIIRTTNSLGTFKGIVELFIIEQESEQIIAASKNRYTGSAISELPVRYRDTGLEKVLREGGKTFGRADAGEFVFAYRAKILSEDKKSKIFIVILMLLTSDGISGFLEEFRNTMLVLSALAFGAAILMFYFIIKLTLLSRIAKIIEVIEQGSSDNEPRLCPVDSEDELDILVMAYNNSLRSDHEHTMELIAANERMVNLSHVDSLTGVSNRRNFDRVLADEWKRAERQQQPITLMMIDVDHFKQFNDMHGHVAGDHCLKVVAETLKLQLKRPGDLLSRYGGEEFAVILPNTDERWNIVAESCRKATENLALDVKPGNPAVHVTISIGAAYTVPRFDESPRGLLERADRALYKAKENGRNQVALDLDNSGRT